MKAKLLTAVLGLAVLASVCCALAGTKPLQKNQKASKEPKQKVDQKKKAAVWMKMKLAYSQNILKGLTEGDFKQVGINAKALNVTDFLEMLFRSDNPQYRQQIYAFALANQELIRQADKGNIEGATLAYTQLTVSCVQCHNLVRDAQK